MRLIGHEAYRLTRWKNGGGITQEIAVFPKGSSTETFGWRLSLATVSSSGPFSRFEGVDRSLACLRGNGMRLRFGDGRESVLRPGDDPLAFAGEEAIHADCLDGETIDLNVMTRRSAWRHMIARVVIEDPFVMVPRGEVGAIFLGGPARVVTGTEQWQAGQFDSLLREGAPTPIRIEPASRLEMFVISFSRAE